MKKSLLLSIFCIYVFVATAQITINTSDVAGVNKAIYNATDTIVSSSLIGFPGVSQSWNMTSLTADIMDTLNFLPYSSAPNSNFSTANLVIQFGTSGTNVYTINSASSLSILGYTAVFGATPIAPKNTPAEILMNFPATYNTTYNNNYKSFSQFYFGFFNIDSVRQRSDVKKTVLADAWGNLTTPYGTYAVLRFKETKITHDTIDGYTAGAWVDGIDNSADSTTSYTWWAKTVGFPLATATMDSTGGVSKMEWLSGIGVVGMHESVLTLGVYVYPNPAQNIIRFDIETSRAKFIRVFDITGRVINTYEVVNDKSMINTSDYVNGTYVYSIIGKNDEPLSQGKFSVVK